MNFHQPRKSLGNGRLVKRNVNRRRVKVPGGPYTSRACAFNTVHCLILLRVDLLALKRFFSEFTTILIPARSRKFNYSIAVKIPLGETIKKFIFEIFHRGTNIRFVRIYPFLPKCTFLGIKKNSKTCMQGK